MGNFSNTVLVMGKKASRQSRTKLTEHLDNTVDQVDVDACTMFSVKWDVSY